MGETSTPTPTADFGPVLEGIGAYVDARLPRWHAPGIVVGLTDRDHLLGVVAKGWADLAGRWAMSAADRFQIGSISKSFAAIIALQEHERGHLDLHAPVTEYVPWFAVRSRFAPITLHHLLTHTSGLIEGMEASLDPRHEVWLLRGQECTYAPGERFVYSNDGYKLVGLVLENVTGVPFPRLLADRVLVPLGMDDSDSMITLATRASTAKPHQRLFVDRPWHTGQPLVESPWYETASADGSIVSTARDMCAYARLLLRCGEGPGGRLLGEDAFGLLAGRHVPDPTQEGKAWYGYGLETWDVDGRILIGHSGGMVGFTSYLLVDPEAGLGVVALMNGNDTRQELARYALAAGRAAAGGSSLPEPPPPADPAFLGDAAGEYAGVYRAPPGDDAPGDPGEAASGNGSSGVTDDDRPLGRSLTLAAVDGRLVLRRAAGDVVLERDTGDVFLAPHPDLDRFHLRFWRDDRGQVTQATHGGAWYVGPAYGGPTAFPPVPDAAAFRGHYHNWSAWTSHLRIVERTGSLWLIAPWLFEPACEIELVPLGDGVYRVGREEWRQSRLRIDTVLDGRATRVVCDFLPFHPAATP